MPPRRKTDRHLPRRVYRKHGAFWYVDKANKWHRLGDSEPEALRALAGLMEGAPTGTMDEVFARYRREILPKKAARTAKTQGLELDRLAKVFGHMLPTQVQPADCWEYYEARGAGSAAHHEVRLLSHVYTWARRWGLVRDNPARGLGLKTPKARTRYVTDEEFLAVREIAPPMVGLAMDLALLTGLRQGDLLALERRHITDEGIAVRTSKTGAGLLFEWTDELRLTVKACWSHPPHVRQFLICGRNGKAMTSSGFQTLWQRLMAKAVKAGVERFTFHDLRAKSLSDAQTLGDATARAGHADARITARVYRRRPEKVLPLKVGS